jgi:hypothetical protein
VRGALVVGLLLVAAVAGAEEKARPARVVDQAAGYEVSLPAGWQRAEMVDAKKVPELVAMFTSDATGQVIVISSIAGSTDDAYSGKEDFFQGVERGVTRSFPGFKSISSRRHTLGKAKLPALDLWFRASRDGKDVVVGARFVFYKGRALSLVIDQPGVKKPGKATRAILESFKPVP